MKNQTSSTSFLYVRNIVEKPLDNKLYHAYNTVKETVLLD